MELKSYESWERMLCIKGMRKYMVRLGLTSKILCLMTNTELNNKMMKLDIWGRQL